MTEPMLRPATFTGSPQTAIMAPFQTAIDSRLMNTDELHAMMTAGGTPASQTSDLGKQFLYFVTGTNQANDWSSPP